MAKPEYADPAWQRVRREVLARDNHICQIQSPICRTKADAVDHIIAISQGGPRLDPRNLQAACISCNTWKRHQPQPATGNTGYAWP
jgi:5-methylcytosine-specific restriction endonuclease McrA